MRTPATGVGALLIEKRTGMQRFKNERYNSTEKRSGKPGSRCHDSEWKERESGSSQPLKQNLLVESVGSELAQCFPFSVNQAGQTGIYNGEMMVMNIVMRYLGPGGKSWFKGNQF
ncbi:Hypothetical predicted protein [Pelobates cultripes]|uniref:Uncharacterized protein n=1 Tax=Pelobates cultripes TaxID=61616 RepID=A0AAD1TLB1_PELCU|nr:Hypothetical predicted protein [Pelobates cultripes]